MTAAQQAEQQKQNRLLVGQRRLGFGPPPELFVDPLQRVGGAQRLPLRGGKASKGKKLIAGFLPPRWGNDLSKYLMPNTLDSLINGVPQPGATYLSTGGAIAVIVAWVVPFFGIAAVFGHDTL